MGGVIGPIQLSAGHCYTVTFGFVPAACTLFPASHPSTLLYNGFSVFLPKGYNTRGGICHRFIDLFI